MDCRDAQFYLRLRRHAADELGGEVTGELLRHMAHCPACATEARTLAAFDRAIATAVQDVPMPPGLRSRLIAHVSARRGAALRRKAFRYAGLAAALLLSLGVAYGAYRSTRPHLDTAALADEAQRLDSPQLAEETVAKWLAGQNRPRDLPRPFDYDLYVFHGTERIQGRDVPVVVFRESTRSVLGRAAPNPKGRAKVYILRADDTFDTRDMKPAGNSNWTVDVIRDRPGFVYVIVHTGELERFYRGWGEITG